MFSYKQDQLIAEVEKLLIIHSSTNLKTSEQFLNALGQSTSRSDIKMHLNVSRHVDVSILI